jgi:hypothetical protein
VSISVDDLSAAGLGQLFEELEAAVEAHLDDRGTNVAVVAEPFAGREVLLDYAEETFGLAARRVTFDDVVDELPSFEGHEVVLVDHCQYLYTREVGGFETLDAFLDRAAVSNALFVTSWNRYAWEYLRAVRDVDEVFPTVVEVPPLDAGGTADLLLSNYAATMPEFVETGAAGRVKTLGVGRRTVGLGDGRSVSVPVPELNLEYLTSRTLSRAEHVQDTQAVVFDKIARLSNGNPGVATTIWERSLRDGEIAPAYVDARDIDLDVDDDEAFVLEVLLAKDWLSLGALSSILDQLPVQRLVQSLAEQGLVLVEDDSVSVEPEALHAVDSYLKGRRLVW